MSKIIRQLKKMEVRDWKALCLLVITFIPGKLWKCVNRDIWIITEYKDKARDNGYWLFKYINDNSLLDSVYYPIDLNCEDYDQIKDFKKVIKFGGIKHYLLFWSASKFIGTTKYYGFPYGRICEDLVQWNLHGFKNIFINHGVARGYSSIVDASETNYDLVIAVSEYERNIIINENNQPEEIVKPLGFCRFDNLTNEMLDKKRILIMPTWRNWLDFRLILDNNKIEEITREYLESAYFNEFNNLLNDEEFINFIEQNDIYVDFYLHDYAQVYTTYFNPTSPNINVAKTEDNLVQDLLKSASLLITDYSSVVYDYAYMKKPILYFQFDKKDFEENQYSEGENFTYKENGFGDIVFNKSDLLNKVIDSHTNGFSMPDKYLTRVEEFFEYFDQEHCKRIFEEIGKVK